MHDPFGRSALPPAFDREARVRLIAEAAEALLAGEMPNAAARLFVAGALSAWLRDGGRCGSLERDFLRVTQRERSTLTPQRLLARSSASRATADDDEGTIGSDETDTFEEHDDD